jgi:hypothetical protein
VWEKLSAALSEIFRSALDDNGKTGRLCCLICTVGFMYTFYVRYR